jgi:hypothetical protein
MVREGKESREVVKIINKHGPSGFVAFVAWVGAFVYFVHAAKNFGDVLWGFVESLVWPGVLVYHVLKLLGA